MTHIFPFYFHIHTIISSATDWPNGNLFQENDYHFFVIIMKFDFKQINKKDQSLNCEFKIQISKQQCYYC